MNEQKIELESTLALKSTKKIWLQCGLTTEKRIDFMKRRLGSHKATLSNSILRAEFYRTIAFAFLLKVLPCINKACMYVTSSLLTSISRNAIPGSVHLAYRRCFLSQRVSSQFR